MNLLRATITYAENLYYERFVLSLVCLCVEAAKGVTLRGGGRIRSDGTRPSVTETGHGLEVNEDGTEEERGKTGGSS